MGKQQSRLVMAALLALGVGALAADKAKAVDPTVNVPLTFQGGVQIVLNLLANLTNVDVFTVPAGRNFMLTDLIISKDSTGAAVDQRVFTGAGCITERTAFLSVPGQDTLHIQFATGIGFTSGQVVCIRNGASAGPTNWTIRGYLFN